MNDKNIKKSLFALCAVCTMGLLAGCSARQSDESAGSADSMTEEESEVQETEVLPGGAYISDETAADDRDVAVGTDDGMAEKDIQLHDEPSHTENASDELSEDGTSEEAAAGRQLTADELYEYTEWIQERSNYGFLLSEWQHPDQINLLEVFYNGAGISHEGTEEEIQAFLERYQWEGLETDFFAMYREDVSAFLLEKVGLGYDEIVAKGNKSLEDIYFPETDSFCLEAGDTNYCMFVCTDGVENEEGTIVTLHFQGDDWVKECETRVTKDGRVFLGNHIVQGDILSAWE